MTEVRQTKLERNATLTLTVATVVVGASVITEGSVSRVLNGLAGLTWFASSAMFAMEGRRRGATALQWAGIVALTAGVAFLIKPSDLTLAIAGFAPAGFLAGTVIRKDPVFWAKVVPALYLPMHIGTAVLKAAGRNALGMDANIRTEAPPIAGVVPLVMLAAAMAGGWLAARVVSKRHGEAQFSTG